jgi:geranylgeranyl reductase family protein
MDSCDVLIVGGGPAGSTCAWKLRQAGLDVLLIDKARFPRDKVCGGWITPAVVKELEIDPDEYSLGRVFQPILGFKTGRPSSRMVLTRYDHPVSFGIRRYEFDHFLLRRCGARIVDGSPLLELKRSKDVFVANSRIKTPLVIGAGGHFCPVSQHLGAKAGMEFAVVAQEAEFQLSPGQAASSAVEAEIPELYFCPDMKGYGWCFRKQDYLNIGFGRLDRHQFACQSTRFVEFLRESGKVPRESAVRLKGHAYLLFGVHSRKRIDDGVLLIGDAAGLAYPSSGEGIRPAVESGLIAADIILSAKGDYRRARLEEYLPALEARYCGVQSDWAIRAAAWMPQWATKPIAASVLATRPLTRHVLLDRWFLHSHVSALAPKCKRYSLTGPKSRERE